MQLSFRTIRMDKKYFLIFFISFICSCAPSRFVKPLAKKQQAVNISLGGPLIKPEKATVPIPFITACYAYGIDSTFTGFASVNITSALFGNAQIDLGATKQVFKQKKFSPAVSFTPVLNLIYRNKDACKFYPQAALNAYWEYGKQKNIFYVGVDNWFELASEREYNIKQPNHWIFMPMIGHSFINKKWNFNLEAKIIAPNLSNEKLVVDYSTPFKTNGAMGIYFGCTRKF